jgi:hypothetical protein
MASVVERVVVLAVEQMKQKGAPREQTVTEKTASVEQQDQLKE